MLRYFLLAACLVLPSCGQTDISAVDRQPRERSRSAESFVDSVGENVHLSYFDTGYGNFDLIKARVIDLGVRHLRDGAQLTADAQYNKIFYERLKDLAHSSIRFDLIFDPRSSVGELTPRKLRAITALAGDSLESIEGPNEYDNSPDQNWSNTLRKYQATLYQAVKSDPATRHLPVIGPSFVHAESRDVIGDLSASLNYGNLHSYPGGKMPSSNLDDGGENEIMRARKVSGDSRPLIATETGYHTAVASRGGHPGVSDQTFAKYVPRLYLEYFNHEFVRTYLYEVSDEKPDLGRTDPEHNFGLLTSVGEPKPAYFSLRNLLSLLAESRPASPADSAPWPGQLCYKFQGNTSEIHHTLLQKRDGRFYLILWLEVASYDIASKTDVAVPTRHLLLQLCQTRSANTYLPLESSRAVRHYDGYTIALEVPDHVLVVEIMP